MAQWNHLACNPTGFDFPKFVAGTPTEADIRVFFRNGTSEVRSPSGASVCGFITGNENLADINLFSHFEAANGTILPCPNTAISMSDLFAHELGHFLGLEDSNCGDYIMGPMPYDQSGLTAIHYPTREVKAAECAAAAQANWTRREACGIVSCGGTGSGPLDDDPGDGSGSGGGGSGGNGPCYWHCVDQGGGLYCDLLCT